MTVWSPCVTFMFPTSLGLLEGKSIKEVRHKVAMVCSPWIVLTCNVLNYFHTGLVSNMAEGCLCLWSYPSSQFHPCSSPTPSSIRPICRHVLEHLPFMAEQQEQQDTRCCHPKTCWSPCSRVGSWERGAPRRKGSRASRERGGESASDAQKSRGKEGENAKGRWGGGCWGQNGMVLGGLRFLASFCFA